MSMRTDGVAGSRVSQDPNLEGEGQTQSGSLNVGARTATVTAEREQVHHERHESMGDLSHLVLNNVGANRAAQSFEAVEGRVHIHPLVTDGLGESMSGGGILSPVCPKTPNTTPVRSPNTGDINS